MATPTRTRGRPSVYRQEYAGMAEAAAAETGATDAQLACIFNVDERTITNWKNRHKDFGEALRRGKNKADGKVAASLFKKANGYEYEEKRVTTNDKGTEVTVFTRHLPPDTTAALKWLNNRCPAEWRDHPEPDESNEVPLPKTIIIQCKDMGERPTEPEGVQ